MKKNRDEYVKKKNTGPSDPSAYDRMLKAAEDARPTRVIETPHSKFRIEVALREAIEILDIWEIVGITQTELMAPIDPALKGEEKTAAVDRKKFVNAKLMDGIDKVLDEAIARGWIRSPKMFPMSYGPVLKKGDHGLPLAKLHRLDRQGLYSVFMKPEESEEGEAVKKADEFHDDKGGASGGDPGTTEGPAGDGSSG